MRRREFITLVGGVALLPLIAVAQERGRIYRLGFAIPVGRNSSGVLAFFDELRLFGFVEGKNLEVVPDGFDVHNDRLAEQAASVVKASPDAIVTGPDNYTRVYQQLTRTIPLIAMTEDMVAAGLVVSLARPGGNTTGISLLSPELDRKRQDLLMEAAPAARRIAMLVDSTVTPPRHIQELEDAARARGVEVSVFGVATRAEVLPAINAAKLASAQAINFLATPLFFSQPANTTRPRSGNSFASHAPVARTGGRGRTRGIRLALHSGVPSAGANGRKGTARRQPRRYSHRTAGNIRARA